jgi:hypothetical protein
LLYLLLGYFFSTQRNNNFDFLDKMPSWLSGLIQHKDETSTAPPPPPPILITNEMAVTGTQKSEATESKNVENKSFMFETLLKQKDSVVTSTLELIQDLTKKKQDIQQATLTLIQEQQNSDLLIKVYPIKKNIFLTSN